MIRTFRPKYVALVAFAVAAIASVVAPSVATAKPFFVAGTGVAPRSIPLPGENPRPHLILGIASNPLGLHTGRGAVRTLSVDEVTPASISGTFESGAPFVFRALNGDRFVTHYGRTDKGADEVGTYTLKIGPTTETTVSLVVEEASHEGEDH